jgi:hypothetical protein
LRIEALVDGAHAPRLVEPSRICGLLIAISDEAGPGQSGYDPEVVTLDGVDGGLSASCLFPGGHVTLHTFGARGRFPGRYTVEITASDPLDTAALLVVTERHLGVPTDYRAAAESRGWLV